MESPSRWTTTRSGLGPRRARGPRDAERPPQDRLSGARTRPRDRALHGRRRRRRRLHLARRHRSIGLEARATRSGHLEIDSGARVPVSEIARFTADVDADAGYAWLDVIDQSGSSFRVISRALPSHEDPTHTWNEILYESAWAGILSGVLGEWFGVPFDV